MRPALPSSQPSATTTGRPSLPSQKIALPVDAKLMKVDWPDATNPIEPEWCELCTSWVYDDEDSEAFCTMKFCKFRARCKSQ